MQVESLRYLKGVGPKKEELFKKIGVFTVNDILYYFPFRYEDRRNVKKIRELKADDFSVIKAKVLARNLRKMPYYFRAKRVRNIFEVAVGDGTGVINCVWFNQGYLADKIDTGAELLIYGKPRFYKGALSLIAPEFETAQTASDSLNLGRIIGVYPTTALLSQKFIRRTVAQALNLHKNECIDYLPFDIRKAKNFPNIVKSIEAMHFPQSFEEAAGARERFIFEELFFSQVLVYLRKARHRLQKAAVFSHEQQLVEKLKANLKFDLTAGQETALREIIDDLQKPYPMHRLLQGDVGCGKTIVAAFAFANCVNSGYQAAFMVPTEVLAYQHKETLEDAYKGFGYNIEILVSSLDEKKQQIVRRDLKEGRINIIVGTHALIQEEIVFKKLGLVVIDEQHKFGVAQRAMLPKKGDNPHYLVMSATPIPRSLALSLYGDLDLSVIREMPKGRLTPKTVWVKEKKREWVYNLLSKKLKEGRQAYIVYPVIEERFDEELNALETMYKEIKKKFSSFGVGMFHGRMPANQKLEVIQKFRRKETSILVSTTVVEVGVNVENATLMIVENPERFGLAQLHQLRGRIQRSNWQSDFILMSKNDVPDDVARRLEIIANVNDGFKIAEEDLKLRGPGDFFGYLQHGLPSLKIANPLRDMQILQEARLFAYKVIKTDPALGATEHRSIREYLSFWFKNNPDTPQTGEDIQLREIILRDYEDTKR
ncbi:MAG: ATP-dependent DNA helicase RecG [Candidatus Omnitrophica bacterium]|nr:ATP-dependent DNA helicase RecG [Candidatus Omnitrophota bacterium]